MYSAKFTLALVAFGALASPAFAQSTSQAPTPSAPPASAQHSTAASGSTVGANQFMAQAEPGQWRASKLVGVDIYGPDNVKVGDIDEVMVDQNGSVQAVVIGVGGFLGIGTKDVALPFKSVKWEMTAPSSASSSSTNRTDTNATRTTGTGSGASSTTTAAADMARDYPARGVIQMTREQLQAAPSFRYASDTRSSTDNTSGRTTAPSTAPTSK